MIHKLCLTLFILCASVALTNGGSAQDKTESKEDKKPVIYEAPTMKNISQLYWALNKFDIAQDESIDNFLLINECDLYKDYYQNEFEWRKIRKSARDFLTENKSTFGVHFELFQPLRIAEYDFEKETFDFYEPYKIEAARQFEVLPLDFYELICGVGFGREIPGYPRGLHVEVNRPFTLDEIYVPKEIAQAFIETKQNKVQKAGIIPKTKEDIYDTRDAYILMKLRVFGYKDDVRTEEYKLSKVLGVLEGYEIYGDRERKLLLDAKNFKRKKTRSAKEMELKRKYQERLKKRMEEKKKAAAEAEKAAQTPQQTAPVETPEQPE